MRWTQASLCTLAVFAALPLGPEAAAPSASVSKRRRVDAVTTYRTKSPGVSIKLFVQRSRIVVMQTSALLSCAGGFKEPSSISVSETRIRIKPSGHFKYRKTEAFEDSGWYFTALAGQVRSNTTKGFYTAWEERDEGEEEEFGDDSFGPRCGTRSPRGRAIRFVAYRVTGPPWRFP